MTAWIETTLGSICDIKIGGTPSRNNPSLWDVDSNESNHWVSIRDLDRPRISSTAERISTLGINKSNAKLVRKGTVLLSFKLTIGKVAIADVDLFTNEAIAALETDSVDNNFLFHGLHHWNLLQDVDQAIKGVTLNKAKLHKIRIQIPAERNEQKKIAEILSTVDAAIDQTQALIDKFGRAKRGLMQDLLTRGIDENGNIRSKETHKFNIKNGIDVPDEWDVVPLGELGCWISGGTPSMSVSRFWKGSIPWVSAKDLKQFRLSEYKDFLTDEGAKRGTRVVPPDSILVVVRGMILAHTFPVSLTTTDTAFNQDLRACICNPEVSPLYMAFWLLANGPALLGLTTTSTHGTRRFDSQELLSYSVGLPSERAEQERIVQIIEKADERIDRDKEHLSKLLAIKRGLMHDLLSGRQRVNFDA